MMGPRKRAPVAISRTARESEAVVFEQSCWAAQLVHYQQNDIVVRAPTGPPLVIKTLKKQNTPAILGIIQRFWLLTLHPIADNLSAPVASIKNSDRPKTGLSYAFVELCETGLDGLITQDEERDTGYEGSREDAGAF